MSSLCWWMVCFVLCRPWSEGWPHYWQWIYFLHLLSNWLFHGESCPRLDVVHPGRAWSSACVHLALFLAIRELVTPWTNFLHLSLSSVILVDSSTGSPVHVLMLSIQAVCGLLACVHLALFLALPSFSQATALFPRGVTMSMVLMNVEQQIKSGSQQWSGCCMLLSTHCYILC